MRLQKLGYTDEMVASFCLGTMYFGSAVDEATSFALLDQYRDMGGNFIDTANNYAFWVDGCSGGESERLIGRWLAARGGRDDLFLATKVGFNMPPRIQPSLSRQTIIEQCEQSLRQLQTDTIDLFYAHVDEQSTPLEESLAAFDELVQQGKVRYIGCSNTHAERIREAQGLSDQNGWAKYCCVQQRHSYLRPRPTVRQFANGQVPVTDKLLQEAEVNSDLTIVAYSTLLGGVYAREEQTIPDNYQPDDYEDDLKLQKLAVLKTVAEEAGATPNQVVLAWLVQNTPSMIALVSSSSAERLQENLDADQLTLTKGQLERLNGLRENLHF